jgi:hypothetical protein
MIYLNKILPVFVMPIMLLIYLMIYGVWKKKNWPIYAAMIGLYVFSTPIFAKNFLNLLKEQLQGKRLIMYQSRSHCGIEWDD